LVNHEGYNCLKLWKFEEKHTDYVEFKKKNWQFCAYRNGDETVVHTVTERSICVLLLFQLNTDF